MSTERSESKNTILIVDDNITNLNMLSHYLAEAGFEVLVAVDGEEALQQTQYAQPDIILLDVMMPGIDGFETCRQLKTQTDTADIPVIFMTALADVEDKVKGFAVGAVDYVTKPIQGEEVIARLNTHLAIRTLQKKLILQNELLQQEIAIRIQAEQHLHNYTLELQQRNEELDTFAHTVAHDLKNPLNAIIVYTDLLIEDGHDPACLFEPQHVLKDLHEIKLAAGKMVDIIEALLLLAGVSKQRVDMIPLDMATIVTEVQQRLSYMIQEYQGHIHFPRAWPQACGYAPWVEEIWANYISNGLKYGGQPPRLQLGADSENNGLIRFWVRDNGYGLSQEQQQHLFIPFAQINQKRHKESHGLGLSIIRNVVKKLGGQVGVESRVGQGSTFYFTLPKSCS
jgi:signal transduction histidine kinase